MNAKPVIGIGFMFANDIANFGVEDLGTPTRKTAQARFFEFLKDVTHWPFGKPFEPFPLYRSKSLKMQIGVFLVHDAYDIEVPIVRHLMMQTANDVHFGCAPAFGFLGTMKNLFIAHEVCFLVFQIGTKCAENTSIDTHIRGV